MTAAGEIRIGVSACLLGEPVRYNGGHKRDSFLVDVLGRFVTFVPVCPEVELGLGTPRETLRLVRGPAGIHMIASGGADYTRAMRRYAERRVAELRAMDLSGYVLKKDSPSCGMERVKVYGARGAPSRAGRGLFAEALLRICPLLPVEEEGRLQDPRRRENFLERVFAYHRLRRLFGGRWKQSDLVAFHATEKYLALAHDPAAYHALERLVTAAKKTPRAKAGDGLPGKVHGGSESDRDRAPPHQRLQHAAGFLKGRRLSASSG